MNSAQEVVREASSADVPEIVSLINRAFAVESFFKRGDRTDPETVRENMNDGKFLLLYEGDALIGCVYVKISGDRAYLGTLSIDPARQKSGLGRRLMGESEAYARARGCKVLDIRIVNLRTELPPIYRKFGFVETGTEVLKDSENFTRPVHFLRMSKSL